MLTVSPRFSQRPDRESVDGRHIKTGDFGRAATWKKYKTRLIIRCARFAREYRPAIAGFARGACRERIPDLKRNYPKRAGLRLERLLIHGPAK